MTNSAIHSGLSWAVNIKASGNILLQNNVFFGFRPLGVVVQSSRNVTIDNNVVGNIVARTTLESTEVVDVEGAYSICSISGTDVCSSIYVTNNIAGGSIYTGFAVQAHDCGSSESQQVFRNNVAHSIKGMSSGHGAIVKADASASSHSTCFEASYFAAYKCYYMGATSFWNSKQAIFSHMTMIDNNFGLGINLV